MTTQKISHGTQAKSARRSGRPVVSSRRGGDVLDHAPVAAQSFQLFKAGSIRVHRRPVTIAPASVAGLVLACVSITACKHAASHPLNEGARQSHEASVTSVPDRGVAALSPAPKHTGKTAEAKPLAPMTQLRAGAVTAMNTAQSPYDDAQELASTSSISGDTAAFDTLDAYATEAGFTAPAADPDANPAGAPATDATRLPPIPDTTVPLAQPQHPWTAWGAPTAATVAISAGLLALARRRRARKSKDNDAHARTTVIGWKGWSYRPLSRSRAEFFGAEHPDLPQAWAVERVQLNDWAGTRDTRIKPATDGRYGLVKPVRPPKIDLSMDDDAFIHWASCALPLEPVEAPNGMVTLVAEPAADEPRRNTEAAPQREDYDHSPSHADDVAMAQALVSLPLPALPSMQEKARAEDIARAERERVQRMETARRDALERERQAREASERDAAQREAARIEAARIEAERVEAERVEEQRRQRIARETLRAEAEQRNAKEASQQRDNAVAEAKKQLTAGYPSKALDALAPALTDAQGAGEAWTVAGWCWWRMARDNGPGAEKAVAQAIQAFHRAIAAEPDRESMLGSALIRCHLFMADHLHGNARAESLDAALRLMGNATATRSNGNAKSVHEYASTLHERALLSDPDTRSRQLEQAQQMLAGLRASDIDADTRWLMVTLWLAQARQMQGRDADAILTRAADALAQVPADATQETRDNWLARLIEVELQRLSPMKGAARLMRLRQLRDIYEPKLSEARSILPLLSWIQVLREWADMLSERPAREKLAEAEALFDRIESLSPDDLGAVHFARAYYLRLRSAHESIGAALDTLEKADTLLINTHSTVLSAETILLGRAEIALARAPLLDPRERKAALAQAIRYSDASVSAGDGNLSRALTCGITARLAMFEATPPSATESEELLDFARCLRQATPYDPEALRLSARCEFITGHAAAAGQFCEAAWDAGCRDAELLRLWRESLSQLPNAPANAANDPPWKRLNQCLRLAQSTGQATR